MHMHSRPITFNTWETTFTQHTIQYRFNNIHESNHSLRASYISIQFSSHFTTFTYIQNSFIFKRIHSQLHSLRKRHSTAYTTGHIHPTLHSHSYSFILPHAVECDPSAEWSAPCMILNAVVAEWRPCWMKRNDCCMSVLSYEAHCVCGCIVVVANECRRPS